MLATKMQGTKTPCWSSSGALGISFIFIIVQCERLHLRPMTRTLHGTQAMQCFCYASCAASCRWLMSLPTFPAAYLHQRPSTRANLGAWPAAPGFPTAPAKDYFMIISKSSRSAPSTSILPGECRPLVKSRQADDKSTFEKQEWNRRNTAYYLDSVWYVAAQGLKRANLKVTLSLLALGSFSRQLKRQLSSLVSRCLASILIWRVCEVQSLLRSCSSCLGVCHHIQFLHCAPLTCDGHAEELS